MFDVSFSELLLIGVIALVVIGPERLPKVARTIGHLLGRAQRYVNDVKTDIRREMDAEEFSKLKDEMEEARNSIRASVDDTKNSLANPMEDAKQAMEQAAQSINETAREAASMPDTVSPQLHLDAVDPPPVAPVADAEPQADAAPAKSTAKAAAAPTPSNETST